MREEIISIRMASRLASELNWNRIHRTRYFLLSTN